MCLKCPPEKGKYQGNPSIGYSEEECLGGVLVVIISGVFDFYFRSLHSEGGNKPSLEKFRYFHMGDKSGFYK